MSNRFFLTLISLLLGFILVGCKSEKYGTPIDKGASVIKIREIIANKSFVGQRVKVEGVITTQCLSSGCWFTLKDETGQIFVNLAPAGLTLPPKIGKRALVEGEVAFMDDILMIVAHGVEIR